MINKEHKCEIIYLQKINKDKGEKEAQYIYDIQELQDLIHRLFHGALKSKNRLRISSMISQHIVDQIDIFMFEHDIPDEERFYIVRTLRRRLTG